jgi:hypothetical protein
MSRIIGQLALKLQSHELHEKYKNEFISFYKSLVMHKNDECRENAAFNLPAMNLIYRKFIFSIPALQSGLKFKPVRQMTGITESTSFDDEEECKFGDEEQDQPFDFNIVYAQFAQDPNPKI